MATNKTFNLIREKQGNTTKSTICISDLILLTPPTKEIKDQLIKSLLACGLKQMPTIGFKD